VGVRCLLAVKDEGQEMSIHSCSYYCNRPECIKAQRDELVKRIKPSREWVGLTDEEIYEAIWPLCTSDNQVVKSLVELSMDEYRAIEKALKEKNT
jgi:hypothetical protein